MEYKLLEEQDAGLMRCFVDDEHTEYDEELMCTFLKEKNAYGYIAKEKDKIVGFAYGYAIVKPDGRKYFYLHAIDIMENYQKHGYGTELMKYIYNHSNSIGCSKMFLITNKSNVSACKCYEKAYGISKADDDIVYVFTDAR